MSPEIPPALQAYFPGAGRVCADCGRTVVGGRETEGEPFRCEACQQPADVAEDELTRAALADPGEASLPEPGPTLWRVVALLVFAVVALGIVFWNR